MVLETIIKTDLSKPPVIHSPAACDDEHSLFSCGVVVSKLLVAMIYMIFIFLSSLRA